MATTYSRPVNHHKKTTQSTTDKVTKIFNDLDKYRNFCKEYGYRYDEADLYSNRSYVWRQYDRFMSGKEVKNQWDQNNK